ncbi:AMP deaminase [Nematocida minor]|uniref:AMP deaminase n=1 Tax=Nematocida minor TaxID=1912983 RepID=UPI00222092BC|nr:AMP deaminase [Nematocida minor]KAI5190207.1 AMP deaminase [Nematocida minor]
MEEDSLARAIPLLLQALELRKKYIRVSKQNKSWKRYPVPSTLSAEKANSHWSLVGDSEELPSISEYYRDIDLLTSIIHNGPLKSYCFQRLEHLELQFKMHINQFHSKEKNEQKTLSNKDFYTVVKADTHLHHSASMNSKRLLKYIKKKLRDSGADVVYKDKTGEKHTLSDIFSGINKTVDTLCLDSLGTHSNLETFHRFDRFNSKYNPYGTPILREVFLKHDNYIGGKYLAELTQELIEEIEEKEYLKCEWGISLYGKKENELEVLSRWVDKHSIENESVRWYIQVPRLYGVFKGYGNVSNYAEFLSNIFSALIESSLRPKVEMLSKDKKIAHSTEDIIDAFLCNVVGFDSVDDESAKDKKNHFEKGHPLKWAHMDNPPYSYYMYYMYYYTAVVNRIRVSRGKDPLAFRPHAGESGDIDHLAYAFLTAKSIAHGVKLRKSPVLQYLYYLAQIGIAMSPLSNNSLFIEYRKNPFPLYFQRGLNVSLSTDDPLQFHYTREPLMEEYSIASQIWKLSSCDQCEIARNSVLISNYGKEEKEKWIGKYEVDGRLVNDQAKTNVPPTRFNYRMKRISEEYAILQKYAYRIEPPPE